MIRFKQRQKASSANSGTIFALNSNNAGGAELKDSISLVSAICSIPGTRYGIVNGVVTQFAANQPSIEYYGLRCCTAFTQLCKQSETFSDSVWATARGTIVSAGSFMGSNRSKFTEDLNTNTHNFIQVNAFSSVVTDNSVMGVKITAEYAGRHLAIFGKLRDNTIVVVCTVDLFSGIVSNLRSGCVASAKNLGADIWEVFATFNIGVGTNSPFLFWGTAKSDGTTNYVGDGVSGIYFNSPVFLNFGVNGIPFIPPYVPNNTNGSVSVVSETATATTGMSFDLDDVKLSKLKTALRGPNAQGHLELTLKSNVDSGWLPINTIINIFSCANSYLIGFFAKKDGGGNNTLRIEDGPNAAFIPISLTISSFYKISLDWGTHSTGPKMRLTVNGVKSALANFSGSFGAQDLRFFFGNTVNAGNIKDIKIMNRPQW